MTIRARWCRTGVGDAGDQLHGLVCGRVAWADGLHNPVYADWRPCKVHELWHQQGCKMANGYAPFCKHVFVPNFINAKTGALEITEANQHLLHSGYTKRRPEELAVLSRYLSARKH
eukprot:363670-Chlamydomonas_euryale.AAC.19